MNAIGHSEEMTVRRGGDLTMEKIQYAEPEFTLIRLDSSTFPFENDILTASRNFDLDEITEDIDDLFSASTPTELFK